MGRNVKETSNTTHKKKRRSAMSPEARENQMISYAVDLAEQRLLDGTASSQLLTHYLKQASRKEQLEREKLENENELLRAKVRSLESAEKSEKAYKEVLRAMRIYSGQTDDSEDEYDEDEDYYDEDEY